MPAWRSSRWGSGSPAPGTATHSTPSTTGSRATCASRCLIGLPPSTARSPPWVPSPCRASGSRTRGSGRPPASSASGWSGSCWCSSCGPPGSTWSASTRRASGAGWPSGAGRPPAAHPTGLAAARCWRRSPPSPTAPGPTTSSSPPAATPTNRSSSPPSSPGTGPGSSTSASAAWTCPGPSTTPRSWRSASPARTAPDATTRPTRRTGSTTRLATSAGPNGATWRAFWTSSPRVGSTWTSSSPRCCRSTTRSAPTSGSSAGNRAASACCSGTRPTGRRRAGRSPPLIPNDRSAGRSPGRSSGWV